MIKAHIGLPPPHPFYCNDKVDTMIIDVVFAIVLLYGFYLGFSQGIINTLFAVLSIVIGLLAAFKLAPATSNFLETAFDSTNPLMFLGGFLITFIVTMFLIRTISRALEGLFRAARINFINQLVGGVVLSSVLILLLSMLIWFGDQARLIDDTTKAQSMTYVHLEKYPALVREAGTVLKPTFKEFWDQSVDMLDKLESMSMNEKNNNPKAYDLQKADDEPKFYDIEE
jgi:membrane protein required for colicin V production